MKITITFTATLQLLMLFYFLWFVPSSILSLFQIYKMEIQSYVSDNQKKCLALNTPFGLTRGEMKGKLNPGSTVVFCKICCPTKSVQVQQLHSYFHTISGNPNYLWWATGWPCELPLCQTTKASFMWMPTPLLITV